MLDIVRYPWEASIFLWLLALLPFVMENFNLDFKKDHSSLRASSNRKEQGLSAFGGNRHLASQLMMVMKTFIIVLRMMTEILSR